MSTENESVLDDASIDDPWERMQRLGGAIEVIAANQNGEKVTPARQLLESLEQQLEEAER